MAPIRRHCIPTAVRLALCASLLAITSGCAGSAAGSRHRTESDAYQEEVEATQPLAEVPPDSLFAGVSELDLEYLVETVLARNASLEAARDGWQATLAVYGRTSALEDPRISYSFAPGSIDSDVPYGQEFEIRQMFPFPGKRDLSGESAVAQAEMAHADYEMLRLELAAMAANLAYEAYRLERALEINEDHLRFLGEIRGIAAARYESGGGSQEELLEAEVEAAHLEHRRIELESARTVVRAEMNALLHRDSGAAIPPPPTTLPPPGMHALDQAALQSLALEARPELRGAQATIQGLEASDRLAAKESLPDFGLMASYNSMWMDPEHRWMVGVELNIPLQLGRRSAGRDEYHARLAQARNERSAKEDAVRLEVARAATRLTEMGHTVDLYQSRILPASRDRVAAARAAFETGSMPALTLIDAERTLRTSEMEYQEALASYHRSRVELARSLGRLPTDSGDQP